MDLQIVRGGGRPIGFGRATLRLIVYAIESLPVFVSPILLAGAWLLRERSLGRELLLAAVVSLLIPVLSLVLLLIDGRRRALHDRAAGTLVVHQ